MGPKRHCARLSTRPYCTRYRWLGGLLRACKHKEGHPPIGSAIARHKRRENKLHVLCFSVSIKAAQPGKRPQSVLTSRQNANTARAGMWTTRILYRYRHCHFSCQSVSPPCRRWQHRVRKRNTSLQSSLFDGDGVLRMSCFSFSIFTVPPPARCVELPC